MTTTTIRRHLRASPHRVFAMLIDPVAVARWRIPDGMSSEVHEFDAREGGRIRVSLTYVDQDAAGKSSAHTDTYHGQFVTLIPDELVVETLEFETADPAMQGWMTVSLRLTPSGSGTDLTAVHDGVPPGVRAADNETGWRMALARLAALVDRAPDSRGEG